MATVQGGSKTVWRDPLVGTLRLRNQPPPGMTQEPLADRAPLGVAASRLWGCEGAKEQRGRQGETQQGREGQTTKDPSVESRPWAGSVLPPARGLRCHRSLLGGLWGSRSLPLAPAKGCLLTCGLLELLPSGSAARVAALRGSAPDPGLPPERHF